VRRLAGDRYIPLARADGRLSLALECAS